MSIVRRMITLGAFLSLVAASQMAQGTEPLGSDAQVEYHWQRPEGDVRRLFRQIVLLRKGDQLSKVRNDLGIPTDEGTGGAKQGTKSEKFLTYAIKRVRAEGGNMNDQEVMLFFDQQDRLYEIGYSGLRPVSGTIIAKFVEAGVEFYTTEPPLR